MFARLTFDRDGTRLSCLDTGGSRRAAVLLHGLAGHAAEWAETAAWLAQRRRVIAIDARGHGHSERLPNDVSRAAHVADVAFVIRELRLAPVVLVGQSLGGHAAILTAAAHPDLVSSVVVVEATPGSGSRTEIDEHVSGVRRSLESWPVPFKTRAAALEFWGGASVRAEAWVDGLEARGDGLWPRFDVGVMEATLRAAVERPYWHEWEGLSMPVLLVRGSRGIVTSGEAARMGKRRARIDR